MIITIDADLQDDVNAIYKWLINTMKDLMLFMELEIAEKQIRFSKHTALMYYKLMQKMELI